MGTQKATMKPVPRPDEAILDDIRQALWKEETIRAIDYHDFSVEVENGQVCLSGHISKGYNHQRIPEITWSIPGVVAVHNHLISDHDLSIQVAQALSKDERTHPFTLTVYCYHGWVVLGGQVPNHDIQHAAETAAASVPAVRGVIRLPEIKGEYSVPARDAVQPHIGVMVYGRYDIEKIDGTVHQVVVNPHNRLVTHAVIRVHQAIGGRKELCDYFVPVYAMHVVDVGGIFLSQTSPPIQQFPVFNPTNYPFAPLTWQPPYPYIVGSVRWPRREQSNQVNALIAKIEGKVSNL